MNIIGKLCVQVCRHMSAKTFVVGLSVIIALCGSQAGKSQAQSGPPSFAPLVEVQNEDYVKARSGFHTRLLKTMAAPQPYEAIKPPVGVSEIEYQSGSLRLKAWINQPTDGKVKHPAVLCLHGGHAFDLGDWETSQPYRDAGYVVMTPLLRGENGLPGAYSLFYDEVDDVVAAAEYLHSQPYIDTKHFYVAGDSVGGTMTMLAAMTYSHFTAAASISGSPDQILFCKYAMANRPDQIPFDVANKRELELRSPLAFAASFKSPIRIYYGTQEPHFKLTSSRTAEIAREHKIDAAAREVEGDHDTVVPNAVKLSIEFFRQVGERK